MTHQSTTAISGANLQPDLSRLKARPICTSCSRPLFSLIPWSRVTCIVYDFYRTVVSNSSPSKRCTTSPIPSQKGFLNNIFPWRMHACTLIELYSHTWHMTWNTPVVLRKPMLSIRKEIVRFSSVVSTLPGKLDELGLKALACTKQKQFHGSFKKR